MTGIQAQDSAVGVGAPGAIRGFEVSVARAAEVIVARPDVHHGEAAFGVGGGDFAEAIVAADGFEPDLDLVQRFACDGIEHRAG